MSKMDDIKSKLHNFEFFYAGDQEEAYQDVTYLISIIEQQEQFLIQFRKDTEFMWKVPNIAVMQEVLDVALKAIRGN